MDPGTTGLGEVEDTLKRINSHPGVLGVIVLNPQGIAIKTTMDTATTQIYAHNFQHLTTLARSCIRDLDPLNDLKFLRVRSRKYEIMVAPSGEYSLIVIQNPNQKDVWNSSEHIWTTLVMISVIWKKMSINILDEHE